MSTTETLVRLVVAAFIALPAAGVFAEQRIVRPRIKAWVDVLCVLAMMLALWVAP